MKKQNLSPSRIEELLGKFKSLRVLVVGDVGIDRYTLGTVERISPEAPVPILHVVEEKLKLGLAANVADNIRALSGRVSLVGIVGKDRYSEDFDRLMKGIGAETSGLVRSTSRRTILKERVVSMNQQLLRVDYETTGAIDAKTKSEMLAKTERELARADILIIQDYCKGIFDRGFFAELVKRAKKRGLVIAVDPNSKTPLSLYEGASFMTPNTKEAEALTKIAITDDASLTACGRALLKATGGDSVIITRGKDGMALFEKGRSAPKLIPTYAREVFDVSGAGDTVISLMALTVAAGGSIEEAAILGNLGAGVVVGKRGTATVTVPELKAAYQLQSELGAMTFNS